MLNLSVSDVVGDDLSVIASGPTAADPSTCDEALESLMKALIKGIASQCYPRYSGKQFTPGKVAVRNLPETQNKVRSRARHVVFSD